MQAFSQAGDPDRVLKLSTGDLKAYVRGLKLSLARAGRMSIL
jgi:hypothetical protein